VTVEMQQRFSVVIFEVHVTINNKQYYRAAQKCFYGEFMSSATMKRY
jgi:hypothetical protein